MKFYLLQTKQPKSSILTTNHRAGFVNFFMLLVNEVLLETIFSQILHPVLFSIIGGGGGNIQHLVNQYIDENKLRKQEGYLNIS